MQNRAQWPDTGLVNEVFDFYNDSDKQIAWYDPADYALALEHVIDGHLVVITYASNGPSGFHSAAFWGQEYSDLGDRFDQVAIENIYISYQGE